TFRLESTLESHTQPPFMSSFLVADRPFLENRLGGPGGSPWLPQAIPDAEEVHAHGLEPGRVFKQTERFGRDSPGREVSLYQLFNQPALRDEVDHREVGNANERPSEGVRQG